MMGEQRSPKDLVKDLILAERAGFEFSVISDHFLPCLEEQGHSGYAWSILGAAAQATGRIALMSYVTARSFATPPGDSSQPRRPRRWRCSPTAFLAGSGRRREPQRARGRAWLAICRHSSRDVRRGDRDHPDAVRRCGYVTYRGEHLDLDVEYAKLFDKPDER